MAKPLVGISTETPESSISGERTSIIEPAGKHICHNGIVKEIMTEMDYIEKSTTQTRNDKRREILEYIDEKSSHQDILALQRDELIEEVSDSQYEPELVEEILDDILREEPVEEKTFTLSLLYPNKGEEKITDVIGSGTEWSLLKIFASGFYLFMGVAVFFESSPIFLDLNTDEIAWISFVGLIFSYILGNVVKKTAAILEAQVPIIQEYKNVVYPTIGILIIGSMILVSYSQITGKEIPALAIASIFPTSIVAGIEVGKYIENKKAEE